MNRIIVKIVIYFQILPKKIVVGLPMCFSCFFNKSTMSLCPLIVAHCCAVSPLESSFFTSAPSSSNDDTTLVSPRVLASINGVSLKQNQIISVLKIKKTLRCIKNYLLCKEACFYTDKSLRYIVNMVMIMLSFHFF